MNEPTSYELRPPAQPYGDQQHDQPQQPTQPQDQPHQQHQPHQPQSPQSPTQPQSPRPTGHGSFGEAGGPGATEYQPPASGRLLGGRYLLGARLGHGGMGTVWRAHDRIVDRDVAVKEPRVPDHLSPRERQTMYDRMRREARSAASIDHPSVVTIHDVVLQDEQPWIVMELVHGRSLADVLQEGTLDVREAARVGASVVGALAAAHERGIQHRDVKPENVLLGRHDRVVLTDFGIAQVEGEQRLTETGAFVGSPEYIAPERVLGQQSGPASDLWSLGLVLYTAVEGVSPFRRSTTPGTLQAVLSSEPQQAVRVREGSEALAGLLARLLRKNAAERPGAAEIRNVLAEVSRPPQQVRTVPVPMGDRLLRLVREFGGKLRSSRRWRFGTAGGAVVVAAAVATAVVLSADHVPTGWTMHDESKLAHASVAAPKGYTRSADVNHVTYTDKRQHIIIDLQRYSGNVESDSLREANSLKKYYEDGLGDTNMDDASAAVSEARQQDKPAADIVTHFGDETESYPFPHRVNHERIYVNGKQVRWRLRVKMPESGTYRHNGEQVYKDAVASLEINDL